MSELTGTHNDGGLAFGTQTVTANSVTYDTDDIDINFDTTEIERKGIYGIVNADVLIEQPYKGTATFQLATSATARPPIGTYFTLTADNSTTIGCKVTSVGNSYKQDGETKFKVGFKKSFSGVSV